MLLAVTMQESLINRVKPSSIHGKVTVYFPLKNVKKINHQEAFVWNKVF
jgi:hypothetical protein